MDESLKEYYKIIGGIRALVSKGENIDTLLHHALHMILTKCDADYAVIWYRNKLDNLLHPYYAICPVDLTDKAHPGGEGYVGRCFETQKSIRALRYSRGMDEVTDRDFEGLEITSCICAPISSEHEEFGVVQFAKSAGEFTEESADLCEILSMLVSMGGDDAPLLAGGWNSGSPLIQVRDVKKSYVTGPITTPVLKGVNLNVYPGEFLVLLGESGCGKSTLLNIMSGMDNADEGKIDFMGKNIIHSPEEELTNIRRDNIGFIFQNYNLMPNLNAKENLDIIGELVKNPLNTEEALAKVGLKDHADHYPSQLSGGQQQRVSIARALVKNPKLIFADEPTAALDYATSIEVLEALDKVVKDGTTMVMVTHNEEITRMADRVVRLKNGRIHEISINLKPVSARELEW